MIHKRFLTVGLLAIAALGLGACTDPYSYGRAPGYYDDVGYYSQYDRFYGDPFGFRYVPVGFAGVGFGWYGNYYYPGVGNWVYDRRGVRRAWNRNQQAYWAPRVAQRQRWRRDNGVISNRIAQGIVRDQQFGRGQRRGNQIERRENQLLRQGNRIERQGNQIARQQLEAQRRGNQIERRQLRSDRRANPAAQAGRQARAERPVRAERPQRQAQPQRQARPQRQANVTRSAPRSQQQMRQQYQRQQQSYRQSARQGARQGGRQRRN